MHTAHLTLASRRHARKQVTCRQPKQTLQCWLLAATFRLLQVGSSLSQQAAARAAVQARPNRCGYAGMSACWYAAAPLCLRI